LQNPSDSTETPTHFTSSRASKAYWEWIERAKTKSQE
jgi:hypothetical protein